ncbi:MAG: PorP/SprF family type IX secretion system membrane protein [Bacteroidales bacterium]|nr:PorP/SprF family type IX secretion system membrane protein [Bacteroidales bacterium]MDD4603135.1 PorP/SprF family type IX secretion system membrane protein [Bacteroidales bacterium]
MRKSNLTIFLFFLSLTGLLGQQFPILDNYLINPSSISPAFTGKYYKFQTILTHRSEWTKLSGAPVIGNINLDGQLAKNIGLGGNILINKAGRVKNLTFNLNFAYHLQVAADHFLSFGINAACYQNSIDLTDLLVSDPTDPLLTGGDKITETYFNVGASLLYNWRDLNFCISFPLLFNNNSFYSGSSYDRILTMDRNWLLYANYAVNVSPDWRLKFDFLFRNTQFSSWTIDLSTLVNYKDNYWFGLMYRKNNILGVTAGLSIIKSIILNYNYEFNGFAMQGLGGGTHEISIGYRIKSSETKPLQIKDYAN